MEDNVFDSVRHRRIFLAAVVLLFFALLVGRYFATPVLKPGEVGSHLRQFVISLIDNVTSGFFAAVVVGATIYFFKPKRRDIRLIQQLEAREIVPAFTAALGSANQWLFYGNRGRYLRSKVLPTLANRKHGTFHVEAIVMNPANVGACRKFAEHKRTFRANDEIGDWTVERVQTDIMAAIVV